MQKNWQIRDLAPDSFMQNFPEHNKIVLQLLYNRGLQSDQDINQFLNPDYESDVYDPFLFNDMTVAVERIWQAVDNQEKIVLYGDYDADGICSTTLMFDFLQKFTTNIEVVLPHRSKDGYGLNPKTLPKVKKATPNLVITMDCGSTNFAEVQDLQKNNIDTIIIDHHHEPEKHPPAVAIINCAFTGEKYPTKNLAAVGVTYKVVQGLIDYGTKNRSDWQFPLGFEKWYLDLVAIATITDCVPLYGENRTLVKFGLQVLNKTRRPGLLAMIKKAGLELGSITERHLGFVLGPRLNAAGRIKHSVGGFDLLVAEDSAIAELKAEEINNDNAERQKITEQYFKQAKTALESAVERGDPILFFYQPEWNIGLAGLVAGKLLNIYERPVLIMSKTDGIIKGSGRSIKSFDITSALDEVNDLFSAYGGHIQACGFTLKPDVTVEDLQVRLFKIAQSKIKLEDLTENIDIDMEIPLSAVDWELYEMLEKFTPFGQEAPKPLFISRNLLVQAVYPVGWEQKHLRIQITDDKGLHRKIIAFGFGEDWLGNLSYGDHIDIVYDVDINEWNGSRELQLKLIDLNKVQNNKNEK